MPSYNREGSKVRAAALAIVAAAVPSITYPNHPAPTTIRHYNALRARSKRVAGVSETAEARQKQLPCVSYKTLDAQSVILGSGNKRTPLVVTIESAADIDEEAALANDDPEANHDALVAAVCDVLNDDAAAANLTAAISDFHCYEVFDMGELDVETEDGHFVTGHRWDLVHTNGSLS